MVALKAFFDGLDGLDGLEGLEGLGCLGLFGGPWRGPAGTGPIGRSFGLIVGVNCVKFTPPPAPGRA